MPKTQEDPGGDAFYRLRKGFVLPPCWAETRRVTTQYNPRTSQITAITEKKKINRFVNDGTPTCDDRAGDHQPVTASTDRLRAQPDRRPEHPRATEVLEKIIQEFDKPIQQVLIEAVSSPCPNRRSCSWACSGKPAPVCRGSNPTDFTGLINQQNLALVAWASRRPSQHPQQRDAEFTISALEQSGESQTSARPADRHQQRPATISDGRCRTITRNTGFDHHHRADGVLLVVPQGKPRR